MFIDTQVYTPNYKEKAQAYLKEKGLDLHLVFDGKPRGSKVNNLLSSQVMKKYTFSGIHKEQATGRWYRFHVRYNPAIYLKNVRVPLLVFNGDKDLMVCAKTNLDNWKLYMPKDADVTTIELKGLNHLFLPCKTGLPNEY